MTDAPMPNNISAPHNHQHCVDNAMALAQQLCRERKVRLTAIREQVLEIVWSSHQPIGAYSILDTLSQHSQRAPAPPTVYRALDFLLENKLVHRIASLNAFVGCIDPQHHHEGHFLICQHCKIAIEVEASAINHAIAEAAAQQTFAVTGQCVEVAGYCQRCRQGGEE